MNVRSEEGQLAKQILSDFMADFQSRNPNLHVFSAHLHMDEETPHIHIDFVPVITGSKRGLDTRVSLKGALAEQGFEGGTRGATEWNQWIESEKKELNDMVLNGCRRVRTINICRCWIMRSRSERKRLRSLIVSLHNQNRLCRQQVKW